MIGVGARIGSSARVSEKMHPDEPRVLWSISCVLELVLDALSSGANEFLIVRRGRVGESSLVSSSLPCNLLALVAILQEDPACESPSRVAQRSSLLPLALRGSHCR